MPTTRREAAARWLLADVWQQLDNPTAVPVATAAADLLNHHQPQPSPADPVWLPLNPTAAASRQQTLHTRDRAHHQPGLATSSSGTAQHVKLSDCSSAEYVHPLTTEQRFVNPDIVAARDQVRNTLVFQGLEWNIPAAEDGTVFVHPGRDEVAVLKEFENIFDGAVKGASAGTPANEAARDRPLMNGPEWWMAGAGMTDTLAE